MATRWHSAIPPQRLGLCASTRLLKCLDSICLETKAPKRARAQTGINAKRSLGNPQLKEHQ
jgi:hypothetical protein